MSLTITTSDNATTKQVLVSGEVDVSNAAQLRDAIDAALPAAEGDLAVDLAEVPYIDSTGIGVLVGAAHRASEAGKKLIVARPQKNVERVLGLLGVAEDLNIQQ